ncbi:MAG: hypothetical protein ACOYZ8_11240 [Chloroflexota bacterium]
MAKKNVPIRVTGEGDLAFRLLDISVESGGFIGSSAIIAHRPGISDELVYRHMIATELSTKRSAVIFPFAHPLVLPYNLQPDTLDLNSSDWLSVIQPGKSFRPRLVADSTVFHSLAKIREGILPRPNNSFPIIFVVDTLQKLNPKLDQELRVLIREAPMNRLSVWLHCPLTSIPPEIFSIIGNVAVIWPSKKEYLILKENLSSDQITINHVPHTRGMLFISNIVLSDGKGWQFTEMEFDNIRGSEGEE